MRKLFISLALVLISAVAIAQTKTFISDGFVLVDDGVETTVDKNVVITFDRGFVRIDPGGDNDHINLIMNGNMEEGDDGENIDSYYYEAIDARAEKVIISTAYFREQDKWFIGFFTDKYSFYYRGYFKDETQQTQRKWDGSKSL